MMGHLLHEEHRPVTGAQNYIADDALRVEVEGLEQLITAGLLGPRHM